MSMFICFSDYECMCTYVHTYLWVIVCVFMHGCMFAY